MYPLLPFFLFSLPLFLPPVCAMRPLAAKGSLDCGQETVGSLDNVPLRSLDLEDTGTHTDGDAVCDSEEEEELDELLGALEVLREESAMDEEMSQDVSQDVVPTPKTEPTRDPEFRLWLEYFRRDRHSRQLWLNELFAESRARRAAIRANKDTKTAASDGRVSSVGEKSVEGNARDTLLHDSCPKPVFKLKPDKPPKGTSTRLAAPPPHRSRRGEMRRGRLAGPYGGASDLPDFVHYYGHFLRTQIPENETSKGHNELLRLHRLVVSLLSSALNLIMPTNHPMANKPLGFEERVDMSTCRRAAQRDLDGTLGGVAFFKIGIAAAGTILLWPASRWL